MNCETCGGTGSLWLDKSWFTHDGFRRSRCGICGGTGQSDYQHHDREWVASQAKRRQQSSEGG